VLDYNKFYTQFDRVEMNTTKTELVVKSNKIIEASYRLTLIEQQLILFAICHVRKTKAGLSCETPVVISAKDFAAQFGTNTDRVYSQIKEALVTLYARSINFHDIDPKTGSERVNDTRWISDKSYLDGQGQIQLTFSRMVIPYITRLEKEFTSYRLEKIGKLSSAHAVRLYELLVQYLSIGSRTVEVDWLKQRLQLLDEYKAVGDFKKRVIDNSVSQINEHTDINVKYTQRKTGRVVTHLFLRLKLKKIIQKR
jgi:plasmid replication initiation protein